MSSFEELLTSQGTRRQEATVISSSASFEELFPCFINKRLELLESTDILGITKPQKDYISEKLESIYSEIYERLQAHLLWKQKEKDRRLEKSIEEQKKLKSAVEQSELRNRTLEDEVAALMKSLADRKEHLNRLHDESSHLNSEAADKAKQLELLKHDVEEKVRTPVSEKHQLDFLKGLTRAKITSKQNEKKLQGYFVRKGAKKELKIFDFDTTKESTQSILNKLWSLAEWSFEDELKSMKK